ncbi:adenylate/guanylate cyclase domain-containing protein [Pseudovibrio sp. Ad37]|uniref:adenylate/guanylate cyclase domain-containing protein n=1 Tax=Pseudovibrio sp. Ad37 TaxID=989422 RepID=UPI0007AEE1EE|nr:adenylate/guanylate cyclase domain-containing protein [Pseudovibrio sp. Ad37]KZL28392.1 Adenylate cyclase 1 [Pseudovibrio sp. Ad37]
MLNTPIFDQKYAENQRDRVIETFNQIKRLPVASAGRQIPSTDGISIHRGRHIDAAVMFIDICNFTSYPAWTPEEQSVLSESLSLLFSEFVRVIEEHGGFIEKNTGDGLMAYFAPQVKERSNSVEQALSTALAIFYVAKNVINQVLIVNGNPTFDFRITIDEGPITIAKFGAARRFNGLVAVGTVANIASKLLALADPNSILLGTRAVSLLPLEHQQQFVQLKTLESGFIHLDTGYKYAVWEYIGRLGYR